MENKLARKSLERLDEYQENAYACGSGVDWQAHIGDNLSRYLGHCADVGVKATMSGFLRWIDVQAKEFGVAQPPEDGERV